MRDFKDGDLLRLFERSRYPASYVAGRLVAYLRGREPEEHCKMRPGTDTVH